MIKYTGILALIISLFLGNYLDKKISTYNRIFTDYIESENENANGYLIHFRDLNKRSIEGDSIGNIVVQLFDNIQKNNKYSKEVRNAILNQLHQVDDHLLILDNMSLFNKLCFKLLKESMSLRDQYDYALVIEQIDLENSDSLNLKITPFTYIKDDKLIEYFYQDEIITKDLLIDFKGKVSELKAIVSNPITKELYTIKGQ